MKKIKQVTLILVLACVSSFASASSTFCQKHVSACGAVVVTMALVIATESLKNQDGPMIVGGEQTSGPIVETLPIE